MSEDKRLYPCTTCGGSVVGLSALDRCEACRNPEKETVQAIASDLGIKETPNKRSYSEETMKEALTDFKPITKGEIVENAKKYGIKTLLGRLIVTDNFVIPPDGARKLVGKTVNYNQPLLELAGDKCKFCKKPCSEHYVLIGTSMSGHKNCLKEYKAEIEKTNGNPECECVLHWDRDASVCTRSAREPTISIKENLIGKPIELNGKKVGTIIEVKSETLKQTVTIEIDDEAMKDTLEGKHKNISVGSNAIDSNVVDSNLEQSNGVGEGSLD